MNSQAWAFVIIIHSLLRIGIITFCVTRAKALNRNMLGWGIFALFIPLLAFLWIIFLNAKRQDEDLKSRKEKNRDKAESEILDNLKIEEDNKLQLLRAIDNQEVELSSLRTHHLITEDEYNKKKHIIVNQKEAIFKDLENIQLSQEIERVKSVVTDNITPLIGLLKNTFESNLLTKEEFDQKRIQLFNDKYRNILSMPYCNSTFSFHIKTIKDENLSHAMQRELKDSFKNTKIGQVLLYRKGTYKVYRATCDEFVDLNIPGSNSDYIYIEIPNFLTLIGYPHLQKMLDSGMRIEFSSLFDKQEVL